MAEQIFPTKGNLLKTKRQLAQAIMGYELMDRKRNILVHEMVTLVDEAKGLRATIADTYSEAYRSLQRANTATGFAFELAQTIPVENSLKLSVKSVMGVELPKISYEISPPVDPAYPMHLTNAAFDDAFMSFNKVKMFTVRLAEVENDIYRLANGIMKTQKRANALKNIIIPKFREQVKFISNALEEKEREEFSRQKVIKKRKYKN